MNEIVEYIDGQEGGLKLVNQIVTIATVAGSDPRIIDGQHRLCALMNLHQGTQFFVCGADYKDENARFLEFIKINSNTPLPEMYKDITDVEGFYRRASQQVSAAICEKYSAHVGSMKGDYVLREKDVKEAMFVGLRKRNVSMGDIVSMADSIVDELDSLVLFPQRAAHAYPIPSLRAGICVAQKSAADCTQQCPNPGKVEFNGYCGVHKAQKNVFSAIHTRNRKFAEMKAAGSGFFLLDPRWVDKVLDRLFVMDVFE